MNSLNLLYPEAITPTRALLVELGKTPSVECILLTSMFKFLQNARLLSIELLTLQS